MSDKPVDIAPFPFGGDGYDERYCAYIDVLGFSQLIDKLKQGDRTFEFLRTLLQTLHTPEKGTEKSWYTKFSALSISDAVAISTLATPDGLVQMFHAIEKLATDLLKRGYFIRGALVKGKLYQDEKMVFGEALVNAYRIESQLALYPRVMVMSEIARDISEYSEQPNWKKVFENRLLQSDDGPWYVHVLRTIEAEVAKAHHQNTINHNPSSSSVLAKYDELRAQIQRRFDQSVDNPRHFEKVQWFARYWNKSAPFGTMNNRVVAGPGLGN